MAEPLIVNQGPSPRTGFGLAKRDDAAILFGGVHDDEVEDDLQSTFYTDVSALPSCLEASFIFPFHHVAQLHDERTI
eukprot:SAG11_NODE_4305_length_1958_cov_2.754707_2_plen_77_part_00